MKKIALAVCLISAMGTAFSQGLTPSGSNNHGQNDCQCIGIGIQNNFPNKPQVVLVPIGPNKEKEVIVPEQNHSTWRIIIDRYLEEMRSSFHMYSGK